MIIDQTYFVLEINIAQLSNDIVSEEVDLFINRYEPDFLKRVFGVTLKNLIHDFESGTNSEERIERLVDGYTFAYEGKTYEWKGLRNPDKESPIANFVFVKYIENQMSQQTGIGERKSKGENSDDHLADWRLVLAWNRIVIMMEPLLLLLKNGEYPDYEPGEPFKIINRFNL